MTHRVREYVYRLAWIIAFVWLALGVVDIATGLSRGRGINLIEVLVLLVVAIAILGLGLRYAISNTNLFSRTLLIRNKT
jgi:hypothetical protein